MESIIGQNTNNPNKIRDGNRNKTAIWRWAGYYMVMVVAGRLEISQEFFEAADLDGANAWHKFVYITLPQLKPVLTYIILMCVIGIIIVDR